jgi:hypothetical protein
MVILVIRVRITPANVDPEYVWLKEERRLGKLKFGGDHTEKGNLSEGRTLGLSSKNGRAVVDQKRVLAAGSFGVILQCLGLLWLLNATGFAIPWFSIFPVTVMIAGGVFIIRAIIHGREQTIMEAFSDRRYDSRN